MAAIDNFDPTLGVQLNTYAERRIRGAIIDSLREMDWAPRETRKRSKLIEAAIHRCKQRLRTRALGGRDCRRTEQFLVAEYQKWLTEVQSVELERLEFAPGDNPGRDLLNFVSSGDEPGRRTLWSGRNWPGFSLWPSTACQIGTHGAELVLLRRVESAGNRRGDEDAPLAHRPVTHAGILRLRSHMERVWLTSAKEKS